MKKTLLVISVSLLLTSCVKTEQKTEGESEDLLNNMEQSLMEQMADGVAFEMEEEDDDDRIIIPYELPNRVDITEENLPPIEYLKLEPIDLNYTNSADCFVCEDKVYVILNKYPSPYWITIQDFKTQKVIAEFFKQGNGPGEMLQCSVDIQQGAIVALDIVTNRVSRLDVDEILTKGSSYKPHIAELRDGPMFKSRVLFLNDTTILTYNKDFMLGVNVGKNVPELLTFDARSGDMYTKPYKTNQKYFVANITNGEMIKAKNSDKLILAYAKRPIIKVLDSNLEVLKTYVGPEKNDSEFGKIDDTRELYELSGVCRHYYDSTSSENYSIILNNGVHNEKNPDKAYDYEYSAQNQVFKMFDKNGEIIKRFKIKEPYKYLYFISYSECSNTLYVNTNDEDDETIFCRCVPVE